MRILLILSFVVLMVQATIISSKYLTWNFFDDIKSDSIESSYGVLDFDNSKKKKSGERYGVKFNHKDNSSDIQLYYEKTRTDTTSIIPKDLDVNKYVFKYKYRYGFLSDNGVTFLYGKVRDNLMKETDGGDVYGVGWNIGQFSLMQYLIDYQHFNVYQSDFKFIIGKRIKSFIIGKYINLDSKNSNSFSRNAKSSYFTLGLKLHTKYNRFRFGAGSFLGKRAFAIMGDGFRIQHHAMEFKSTYMYGVGYSFNKNLSANLRYIYQKAKELPINNDNVKVESLFFSILYNF
jgi:hypothetical protein